MDRITRKLFPEHFHWSNILNVQYQDTEPTYKVIQILVK